MADEKFLKFAEAVEKQLAYARGEALAAKLLAQCALSLLVLGSQDRAKLLNAMEQRLDAMLTAMPFAKANPSDPHVTELNEQIRETARQFAMSQLDLMRSEFGL